MPAKRKAAPLAPPEPLRTYGYKLIPGCNQFQYDQTAFARRLPITRAPARFDLFKRIADFITPSHFEWHDWTEKTLRALLPDSDEKKICILRAFPGCAGAGKTYNITSFACLWWLMEPQESSVTLVSTTKQMLRRRGWAEVQRIYSSLRDGQKFGNMVDSRTIWQAVKGDDRHAITAQAVEEGSIQKVVDNLKGIHTRRQMIVIDEATSIPRAIYEAIDNLYSYPDEFIVAVIGNPWSRLDNFGLFCEPDKGWNSVTVESGEWEGKPFEHAGGAKPYIITFDAEKSPNILEGKIVSRHLPKKEEVETAKANSGGGNTAHYWQNKRGFWPPEGLIKTVFTESMFTQFNVRDGKHEFVNGLFTLIGALDPAFGGGDNPCLRFGKIGHLAGGGMGIQVLPPIILTIDANKPERTATYQIYDQLKTKCAKVDVGSGKYMECRPDCIVLDDSGEGGLGDVVHQNWSPLVMRVAFQSSASNEAVSLEDPRPAKEVYFNKRAEMYFYARSATVAGQIKGVDSVTATQLCSLKFDASKRRTVIQDKHEYRAEHANKSPDEADSFVLLVEIARRHGFTLKATGETKKVIEEVGADVEKNQEVYHEENTWQEEEMEPVESFQ
jgi:hypothetical protein